MKGDTEEIAIFKFKATCGLTLVTEDPCWPTMSVQPLDGGPPVPPK
jgi:hypothetical protein